jgi:hypothetical protein
MFDRFGKPSLIEKGQAAIEAVVTRTETAKRGARARQRHDEG